MQISTTRTTMTKKANRKYVKKTLHEKGLLFQEKGNLVHGNKYQYHPDEYTGSHKKTRITCPVHGDFLREAAGKPTHFSRGMKAA